MIFVFARWLCLLSFLLPLVGTMSGAAGTASPDTFSVRAQHGATGDGRTLDTAAVNRAIAAAVAAAGGGTVEFSAGDHLGHSIRLRSNVTLRLAAGATIVAAEPTPEAGYDRPEPNAWDRYPDFGHSHFRSSLIRGERLENVAIVGPGRIHRRGLSRGNSAVALPVGALMAITNITVRDVQNASIFIRPGVRLRASDTAGPGKVRRISITDVMASNVAREQAAREMPEREKSHPDPYNSGTMRSWGIFARRVAGLRVRDVDLRLITEAARPAAMFDDVAGARLANVQLSAVHAGSRARCATSQACPRGMWRDWWTAARRPERSGC